MKYILGLLALGLVAGVLQPKQLAGPPSEFAQHLLPNVQSTSLIERSAYVDVKFPAMKEAKKSHLTWGQDIFVDSSSTFAFSVYLPEPDFTIKLTDANGKNVPLHPHQGSFPIGLNSEVPALNFVLRNVEIGTYHLTITSNQPWSTHKKRMMTQRIGAEPQGVVIYFNDDEVYVQSSLSDRGTIKGSKIGLRALVSEQPKEELDRTQYAKPLLDVVLNAEMEVFMPDGTEIDVQMHDDGAHGDLEANDGIYGALIDATEDGIYRALAKMKGERADGTVFYRTTEHLINVVPIDINFVGTADAISISANRLGIKFPITTEAGNTRTYRAYSEVWGTSSAGTQIPICWIQSMVPVEYDSAGNAFVELELDLSWVELAGAQPPFTLKNAYIVDAAGHVPLTEAAAIPLTMKTAPFAVLMARSNLRGKVAGITREMREGVPPVNHYQNVTSPQAGAVILVHGYCAGDNPWDDFAFTGAEFFLESNSNMEIDEFSKKVDDFAASKGLTSYSIIGHSQGGMVGLHLNNYYFTGMDVARERAALRRAQNGEAAAGTRVIQSVGTPYSGCSAAGSAANLGKAFGVGCGPNYDLSRDGAVIWLSGIGSPARAETYHYTTTYKLGNLFGDYCNMAINMVLEWPNDGTTELDFAKLSGGVYAGNTEKQCHTTGMSYTPQYQDNARNAVLNANAAR